VFFREKSAGKYRYLQIAECFRESGRVRQRIVATLGNLDSLRQSGQLETLLASGARFSEKVSVMGAHKKGELSEGPAYKIGPGLIFHRLWKSTGLSDCLATLLEGRQFDFDVEAAVFLETVHRLVDPGSDRRADRWRRDYYLPGARELDLHQFYRAMAWLGEELPPSEQVGRTPFAPRRVKDLIEEGLFARRRHLFSGLVVALFDTTSIYFEGEGGQKLGRLGNTKDHRSDLKQMVVGLILDGEGNPICCELWPGNTTDVKTLLPVLKRLKKRFHVAKVTVVADRGMISQATLEALEGMEDVEYILGARMRKQKEVNRKVLARAGRYRVVRPARVKTKDPSPLKVKEVWVKDEDPTKGRSKEPRRYVICYNPEQAKYDRKKREVILAKLHEALKDGNKKLVGNKGYRKFVISTGPVFEINEKKIRSEERLDGKYVLRTNTKLDSADVALTYKQLWSVEALWRAIKSLLETRPIWHKVDETICGHVFCSFLGLVLIKELQRRMEERGWHAEWADVMQDLGAVYENEVQATDGKRFVIRSELKGWCGRVFQAVGVAVPPTIRLSEARA